MQIELYSHPFLFGLLCRVQINKKKSAIENGREGCSFQYEYRKWRTGCNLSMVERTAMADIAVR
jgi:hypothetical protein